MPTRQQNGLLVPTGAVRLRQGLLFLLLEEQVEDLSTGDRYWRKAENGFTLSARKLPPTPPPPPKDD